MKITLTCLLMVLAITAFACKAAAVDVDSHLPATPVVKHDVIETHPLTETWGEMARWRIENSDWSIELPKEGWWDFVNPLIEPGATPTNATYRSRNVLDSSTGPYVFVDVVRLSLSSLNTQDCAAGTFVDLSGNRFDSGIQVIRIDGYEAVLTALTPSPVDRSTTGTYQVCFTTDSAMYQLIFGARPGYAEQELLTMIESFRLDD